jgi:hypothetical protein
VGAVKRDAALVGGNRYEESVLRPQCFEYEIPGRSGRARQTLCPGLVREHARPRFSDATCAANGVDLREPRNPQPPAVAHESVLPCRSVIVIIVLLKEAWMCATASTTCFLTFLRFGVSAILSSS